VQDSAIHALEMWLEFRGKLKVTPKLSPHPACMDDAILLRKPLHNAISQIHCPFNLAERQKRIKKKSFALSLTLKPITVSLLVVKNMDEMFFTMHWRIKRYSNTF
jgi:hypothetical protein